ncbi:hypothetical protein NBO_10g0090 [Nosema bombycis CQ1]|uniref:Uncharacterized protein n=1 Tax=Nosema bombycis (strain CQ1 / CVCC 102059) TaxID=578461 RepID=R0MLH7_NOSB1|nr:hypothetical protein NBO_10g0090 [Nosema bombycis CQ1]|eukprot:EOB15100.1 hypothetical protein NBO_10g0090 [Nosema bombycis CQ1]
MTFIKKDCILKFFNYNFFYVREFCSYAFLKFTRNITKDPNETKRQIKNSNLERRRLAL